MATGAPRAARRPRRALLRAMNAAANTNHHRAALGAHYGVRRNPCPILCLS
jgi:hypothetical protein